MNSMFFNPLSSFFPSTILAYDELWFNCIVTSQNPTQPLHRWLYILHFFSLLNLLDTQDARYSSKISTQFSSYKIIMASPVHDVWPNVLVYVRCTQLVIKTPVMIFFF